MKKIITIFIFLNLSNNVYAQYGWTQNASLPGGARFHAISFTIGGKAYVGLGTNSTVGFTDLWEYDTLTNAWTQKANFPLGWKVGAVAFAIGNKGYVATGLDSTGVNNDLWEYDPVTDSWTQKASLPADKRDGAIGFSIGNKGYVGIGVSAAFPGPLLDDFWEYDPINDTWTQKANFPGGVRAFASGFSIGNKGYIGLGSDGNISHQDVWEYNASNDSWIQKTSLGGLSREDATGFSIDDKGYFGTGFSSFGCLNNFQEYDTLANSWTQKANLVGSSRSGAVGFSIGKKGFVAIGGCSSASFDDLWEYSDTTVSIDESINRQIKIEIFPNPNSGFFTIKNIPFKIFDLNIYNLLSEKIYFQKGIQGTSMIDLNLPDHPNGIYFLKIEAKGYVICKKFIINN
jgi:N-acetylneuraminic acid mutarotase